MLRVVKTFGTVWKCARELFNGLMYFVKVFEKFAFYGEDEGAEITGEATLAVDF